MLLTCYCFAFFQCNHNSLHQNQNQWRITANREETKKEMMIATKCCLLLLLMSKGREGERVNRLWKTNLLQMTNVAKRRFNFVRLHRWF